MLKGDQKTNKGRLLVETVLEIKYFIGFTTIGAGAAWTYEDSGKYFIFRANISDLKENKQLKMHQTVLLEALKHIFFFTVKPWWAVIPKDIRANLIQPPLK